MLRFLAMALLLAGALAGAARAECYADYKAKQEPPLRLQYGVMQLSEPSCADPAAARAEVAERLARQGWTLLRVVSIFGPEGLAQRKADAGAWFLRF